MHSSWMRTVSCSTRMQGGDVSASVHVGIHPPWAWAPYLPSVGLDIPICRGVSARGVCLGDVCPGGVCMGGCLPGGVCPVGVGVLPGGCLPKGVSAQEGSFCPGRVSAQEGCVSQHTLSQAPPCRQNSWHTLLKTLPCRNFVADGKNAHDNWSQMFL